MIKRMDEEAKASFEEMYLTYQDTLRRLAYAYDIPLDDIDDIIQDTFVSYARYDYSLKQPEEGKKILLGRILRSRCMDFHRQKKKRYCEDLNGETFAAEEYRMQLHQPGLVDVFSGKERCKAILDEVDRMPENWQKVAELKLIEGRPTSEVCDQLSISEKACYSGPCSPETKGNPLLAMQCMNSNNLRMGNAGLYQRGNGFYRIAETAFFHCIDIGFPVFVKIKHSSA